MKNRNQSLDMLRGVAVLMVLVCHYLELAGYNAFIADVGNCGVDLFFVLSGFLISGLLFAEFKATGTIDLKRFWIRRGFKIYPSFYLLILATAVLVLIKSHSLPKQLLGEAFFLQNYAPHFWPHTWSLAVEEHFYFLLPLALLAFIRIRRASKDPFRALPLLSVLIGALCLCLRIWTFRHGGGWEEVAHPTHLRIDALFAGVTLGYFCHFDQDSFREARKSWVLVVGLLLSFTLFLLPSFPRLTFAYVAFSFIVSWAANRPLRESRLIAPFAWIGYYSYSIYLWHMVALMWWNYAPRRWFRFPLYMLAVLGLGVLMAKLIEVPMLGLRNRWFPSARRAERLAAPVPSSHPPTVSCEGRGFGDSETAPTT